MKHYFSRTTGIRTFRRGPRNPMDFLEYFLIAAGFISGYAVQGNTIATILWGISVFVVGILWLSYTNRVLCEVYVEDGVLYRKGFFFGFRTQLTTEYIKGVVYKKTLLGDSILILSNDCMGKPSTWSKSVVVVLDTPNNRDLLHYLKDRDKEEFLI